MRNFPTTDGHHDDECPTLVELAVLRTYDASPDCVAGIQHAAARALARQAERGKVHRPVRWRATLKLRIAALLAGLAS